MCEVIAPSLIPKREGDRVKTDQRDNLRLAERSRVGELTAIWFLNTVDKSIQDLARARADTQYPPSSPASADVLQPEALARLQPGSRSDRVREKHLNWPESVYKSRGDSGTGTGVFAQFWMVDYDRRPPARLG